MVEPDRPRGTVTFLFTDIEGSTRLWQAHTGAMDDAVVRHDAILREAIAAHGGTIYKTAGDAVQAAFATGPSALAAALAAQRALQAEPWPLPEPLRLRMALHTGAVDPTPDGDYRSPALNRLGRLLDAGHGGQVLLTHATAELCREHLPPGAELRDLGERHLRDLPHSERIYQLVAPGLPSAFPPLRTPDARPHNLPAQLTRLVGRERDVATVGELLRDGRLVTITGPGGIGKTRLALQVAGEQLDRFNDGACFVDLAPITDPALVPEAIANTLQIPNVPGAPLDGTLREALSPRELLLVLDNVEQVIAAAPLIGDLLATCPGITVLATSRTRLRLRGEREYPLSPLALPARATAISPEALTQYAAVRLFIDRARNAQPGFAVTNDNAPAVAEICVRLDGLPLAIELALLDGAPRSATITAQRPITVRLVPRHVFLNLVQREPAAMTGLLRTLAEMVRAGNERHEDVVGLDVPGRLAKWLLRRATRDGAPVRAGAVVPMQRSQGELAAELGTTRPTLNRALRDLVAREIVAIDGDRVTILRPDSLRAWLD